MQSGKSIPKTPVIDALKGINIFHPLKIAYLGKDANATANKPAVTKVLRDALKKRGGVFNASVVSQITFDGSRIHPGKTVLVGASYHGILTRIYVRQAQAPKPKTPVIDALKGINIFHPLKIAYLGKDAHATANKPAVTKVLRGALKKRGGVFNASVVSQITFDGSRIHPGKTVLVGASYHGILTRIYVRQAQAPKPKTPVIDALKGINIFHPLKIAYLGKDAHATANKPAVTKVLRGALKKRGGVFNASVVSQITFDGSRVHPGKTVLVGASYHGILTRIYVKQAQAPKPKTPVIDALKGINIFHPLKIAYLGKDAHATANKPAVTKVLRDALKKRGGVFNASVVSQITFDGSRVHPGKTVVIGASYHGVLTRIYVNQATAPKPKTPVIDALRYFSSSYHPVKIDVRYHHHYADEYSFLGVGHKTGDAIRNYLVDHDRTHKINFLNKYQITFSHTYLGNYVNKMQATYHHQTVAILVKLVGEDAKDKVKRVLEKFNSASHRLRIHQKHGDQKVIFANDQQGSAKIRKALVQQGGLSAKLAAQVHFGHDVIGESHMIPLPFQM